MTEAIATTPDVATICVSCCEAEATTTSEGIGHPVCEPCAVEDARNIARFVAGRSDKDGTAVTPEEIVTFTDTVENLSEAVRQLTHDNDALQSQVRRLEWSDERARRRQKLRGPRQQFSIPNNIAGHIWLWFFNRWVNHKTYAVVRRGRVRIPGKPWSDGGLNQKSSRRIGVYLNEKPGGPR
jgi:hypothetical protein